MQITIQMSHCSRPNSPGMNDGPPLGSALFRSPPKRAELTTPRVPICLGSSKCVFAIAGSDEQPLHRGAKPGRVEWLAHYAS
jgi:hypothetical protein